MSFDTMHLFAGAGGGLLADLILGHHPIVAIEWDAYSCQVLRERSAEGWFPGLEVVEGDVRSVDFSRWAGKVDCIHAGFPCQDISAAGKGAGIGEGTRSGLYREVMRAVDAIRPRFVFLENSPNIRTKGRHIVIGDLVARGYAWRDGVLAASDVGAPHQRKRWWCLAADAHGMRQLQPQKRVPDERGWIGDGTAQDDANALRDSIQGKQPSSIDAQEWQEPKVRQIGSLCDGGGWWASEPGLVRMVHGVPHRAHRIKGLGNAQVPLQAATAWCLLGGPLGF